MSVYKDLEKRKLYQKIWAREKVLKKRAIEIVPESVVEIAEPIVEIIVALHFNCEECEFKKKIST